MIQGAAVLLLIAAGCQTTGKAPETYETDSLKKAADLERRMPANVALLPVEAVEAMDFSEKDTLRKEAYGILLRKGFAPLSIAFTDRTLRDMGRMHTPLCSGTAWNTEPFKGAFADYCDALVLFSVERYQESGQTDRHGIDIWGKVGVFDARTMEMLFEHYTRQSLHPTDPGGGRERIIQKAVREFAQLVLAPLPARIPPRTGTDAP
jgi:hypothetical protein